MNEKENKNQVLMLKSKKAIITGISGQDGSYLAELLFSKGYEIYGVDKSFDNLTENIKIKVKMLYKLDLTKPKLLSKLILDITPNEIYHLAAYHFSNQQDGNRLMSFGPFNSINLLATNEILETIRNYLPNCKFFYASSSHIFGNVDHYPQNEETPYRPESLYSITKTAGGELCKFFREYYGVFVSVGILYNHESPRRNLSFITAQIAEAAAKASLELPAKLTVRDLDSIVDWGAAQDYVKAMWLALQQHRSDDYIISSGVAKKVRDFAEIAFNYVGLNANEYIIQDQIIHRSESVTLIGDSTKIRKICGWSPEISFNELVIEMVDKYISRFSNVIEV
ncbi:MAG: GDP-mannose 4,6-dehydratase [Lentimicrobiaceae bacterium]|jgi:GDPmannose 4,6-dehydratase